MRSRPLLAAIFFVALCSTKALVAADGAKSHNDPPEGFVALFNGDDLSGWIGVPHFDPRKLRAMSADERADYLEKNWGEVEKHWSVEDGELVNDGQGPYLTTGESYGDFELRLEYKTVAGADSGIYLRGVPQVQIWDATDTSGSRGKLHAKGSAGLFNNQKSPNYPLVRADKPFGQWNSLKITMVGQSVTVVFNDELVVNEVPLENYWDRAIPVFPVGPIQLQTHGGEIRFRNVFLREIPRKPPEAGYLDQAGQPLGDGWKPLGEAGTSLSGDVEFHVLYSRQDGQPAEFVLASPDDSSAGDMILSVSPETGVTLTDRLSDEESIPVASTPAAASGINPDGQQHLYARIRGNSIQVWLNDTPVVDVLYPHRPSKAQGSFHGADIAACFIRQAENDPRQMVYSGDEEGFTSLYNGKDLSAWTGAIEGFEAEPNVMVATAKSGNIFTKEELGDFNFRFEFKMNPGGNNGVAIRAPRNGHASYDGIECQILDNTAEKYATLKPYQYHGSPYGVVAAKRGYLRPIGHWNQQEIIANGNHIQVILNGKVIVDADIKEASKNGTPDHKEHPGLDNRTGHLGFLGHGHVIEFRNLRVKSLDDSSAAGR